MLSTFKWSSRPWRLQRCQLCRGYVFLKNLNSPKGKGTTILGKNLSSFMNDPLKFACLNVFYYLSAVSRQIDQQYSSMKPGIFLKIGFHTTAFSGENAQPICRWAVRGFSKMHPNANAENALSITSGNPFLCKRSKMRSQLPHSQRFYCFPRSFDIEKQSLSKPVFQQDQVDLKSCCLGLFYEFADQQKCL